MLARPLDRKSNEKNEKLKKHYSFLVFINLNSSLDLSERKENYGILSLKLYFLDDVSS